MEGRQTSAFPGTVAAFDKEYTVSENEFNAFIRYVEKEGTTTHPEQLKKCKNELRHQLKARIAKMLFQDAGLYYILNNDDPAVDKAKQLLRNGNPLVKK